MAVSQKLVDRLNAFNTAHALTEERAAYKRLLPEVEAVREKGPSAEYTRKAKITKSIFDELVKLAPDAKFVPLTFHIAGTAHKTWNDEYVIHSGWEHAHIEHPHLNVFIINLKWESSSGSWWRQRNGKVRVVIGSYGETEQFQQLKDGNHRYAAIAEAVFRRMERQKFEKEQEFRRRGNADSVNVAKELAAQEVGKFEEYGDVRLHASANPNKPVRVEVKFTGDFTAEEAAEIYSFLNSRNK